MRYLQTDLQKLSAMFFNTKLNMIANNCCCALVALWIMGLDTEDMECINIINSELGKGLEEDCTVIWADFFKNVSGRRIKVEFKDITSLAELKKYKDVKIAVKYKKGIFSHWVGVENCKIKYNSLKYSNCVENGEPVTARIITLA